MSVRLLKLSTGEEVVGEVSSDDENGVTIEKARLMIAQPSHSGQVQVALIPWMIGADDRKITINHNHIVAEPAGKEVTDQLERAYVQDTSSLELATGDQLNRMK